MDNLWIIYGYGSGDGDGIFWRNSLNMTGWWLRKKPSEKYEFVNWDDYSKYMGKHIPNHQAVMIIWL